jgi:hypothetical protein
MTGHRWLVEARGSRAAGIGEALKKPLLSADLAKGIARHLVPHRPSYSQYTFDFRCNQILAL